MKNRKWLVMAVVFGLAVVFTSIQAGAEFGPPSEIIEQFDEDGDGKLSQDEMEAAHRARRAKFIETYDTDGDGMLSEKERDAAHDTIREDRKARRAAFFESCDTNGDGQVSEEERTAGWKARKAKMLEKYDADEDGKLSKEERETARSEGWKPGFGRGGKGFCRHHR